MKRLRAAHPISRALKKAKNLSKDLIREFSIFLAEYEDWESQALYLLEDKGEKIETIIEDLFDVKKKEQANWEKPKEMKSFDDYTYDQFPQSEALGKPADDFAQFSYYPLFSFRDWKQEHGFDSIPVEVGDIHTIIRFRAVYTKDREEKFLWSFNRARYGIRGWGNEKRIKSISKSLLDNNNNPGWVVKTFLDENLLLTDENHQKRGEEGVPNPLILSSRDTHSLLFLLLGHPFLYYGDSQAPLRNSFKKVEYDVNVYSLDSHRIVTGIFYHREGNTRLPIIAEDFVNRGFILYGLPKAIVFDRKYHEILPTPIPAKMIRDSFKGILIPNDEWSEFESGWKEWYPDQRLTYVDPQKVDPPNLEVREIKEWRYWLSRPESQVRLFRREKDATTVRMHDETTHFNTNRLALTIENFDGKNSKLSNPSQCPKAAKLFQVIETIHGGKKTEDYYGVERHGASQLLLLAEEYPYAFGYDGKPIISSKSVDFRITVTRSLANENQYLLKGEIGSFTKQGNFKLFGSRRAAPPKAIGMVPSFVLEDGQLTRIGSMMSGRLINDTVSGVIVEESEISDFYAAALPFLRQRNIAINDPQGVLRVSALFNYKVRGKMVIWEVRGILMGRLDTFMETDIGEFPYPLNLNADEFQQTLDNKRFNIPKDFNQEQMLKEEMLETGWVDEGDGDFSMREDHAMKFVLEVLPANSPDRMIAYMGATKLRRWKTKRVVPEISTNISSGIDWFNVDVSMKIDGKLFDLKKIVELWRRNEKAVELKSEDGKSNQGVAVIDQDWISRFAPILNRLLNTSNGKDGKISKKEIENAVAEEEEKSQALRVDRFQIGLLSELEAIATERTSDDEWKKSLTRIYSFKGLKKQRVPKEIKGELRDYQKEGVNWLCFLHDFGFGGILADDMGLGKTLQTLAFLSIMKKKRSKLPNLVIAPTSVVTNWMAEVQKFVPHFQAVLLHGQKRKEHYKEASCADLIITTYGLLQRDLDWLTTLQFQVIILDEAQNIKNARSKTAQAVMHLNGKRRLTLTGTPIENSVMELWSQFNFLMPGFFGSLKEFERDYVKPVSRSGYKKKRPNHGLLRRQTRPFILRRLKRDVAKELPPKTEQILMCEMNERQKQLYNSILEIVRQQVKEKISAGGVTGARIAIFDALLKLRQICCDPRLSPLASQDPPESAKFGLFFQTLTDIVKEGHRVLVFSQFVKMLNLMHERLDREGIPFLQLDGSTKHRDRLVGKFQQSDEHPVFLISLKAGGTGINLTAADYIIHYDPWWNPAVEAQATDRAHRIGQKNHLFVYKLITRNSIEEKIIELQRKKRSLAESIVSSSEPFEKMLNMEDLSELFAI